MFLTDLVIWIFKLLKKKSPAFDKHMPRAFFFCLKRCINTVSCCVLFLFIINTICLHFFLFFFLLLFFLRSNCLLLFLCVCNISPRIFDVYKSKMQMERTLLSWNLGIWFYISNTRDNCIICIPNCPWGIFSISVMARQT